MKTKLNGKSKLIGVGLFALTAAAVTLFPYRPTIGAITQPPRPPVQIPNPQQQPKVEVVFVLDTTSSMSGLISAAKEKIWSIATTLASAQTAPEIKMGLVAYRDHGDAYVTRVVDLSDDLDTIYAALMDFRAAGGGDTPEAVDEALTAAIDKVSWSQASDTYRAVFLVGDAPAHDLRTDRAFGAIMNTANERGIVINTVQAGEHKRTTGQWRRLAVLGHGEFFKVGHDGDAIAITTPFDRKLAELSASLDETRLGYGDKETRAEHARKRAATDKLHAHASVESRARRAAFNVSDSGARNAIGADDLVADIANGKVELSEVDRSALPAAMQKLDLAAQRDLVEDTAKVRAELQQQMRALADKREHYLHNKVAESGAAAASLDQQLYRAIRTQAKQKGLRYESETARY